MQAQQTDERGEQLHARADRDDSTHRPASIGKLVIDVAAISGEHREARARPAQDRDRRVAEWKADEERNRDPRGAPRRADCG